ncbi:MAG TPA: hypothetical protein VKE22_16380 [Haliangiales bacterium]|nr:hypothetical protein [Haliangiales bacterium]
MERLSPEVILPVRRRARVFSLAGLIFLFGLPVFVGTRVYNHYRWPRAVSVRVDADPPGTQVRVIELPDLFEPAPRTLSVPMRMRAVTLRLSHPGYRDAFVHVPLEGGDAAVKAVLLPLE